MMKKIGILFTTVLLSMGAIAQSVVKTIMHDGLQREYRLYVPNIYDGSQSVPLLFNLHGYTSNAFQQEVYGDFRPIADTANFILVHPDGTEDATGTTFWNAFDSPTETVDDLGFISALIDTLAADYNIDLNRVYTTGMSNGGFMSYKLSCDLSERIAAMASVTGSMRGGLLFECTPSHPMPVLEIHGTADPTVPYNGNPSLGMEPIPDVISFWVSFNNCDTQPIETAVPDVDMTDGCTADHFVYLNGDNGATVEHFRVNGGAHTWPGTNPFFSTLGITNQDFSASVEIWRFFSQYTLDQLVSVQDELKREEIFTVYPNPSEGHVLLQFKKPCAANVQVFDALGKMVWNEITQLHNVNLEVPESGVYFLRVETEEGIFTEKLIRN